MGMLQRMSENRARLNVAFRERWSPWAKGPPDGGRQVGGGGYATLPSGLLGVGSASGVVGDSVL